MSKVRDAEESYPWDAVWEYILNEKNFEEPRPKKIIWPKPRCAGGRLLTDEPSYDSDSAYDEAEEESSRQQRQREESSQRRRCATLRVQPPLSDRKAEKPKKRFQWLRRRQRQKANQQDAEQTRFAEISREKFKVHQRQQHREEEDGRDRRSDFSTPRRALSAIHQRRDNDDSVSTTSSAFNGIFMWGNRKDGFGNHNHNAGYGFPKDDNDDDDDDNLSDEVSIIESILNFRETRSFVDAEDHNPRQRVKPRWRNLR